MSELLPRAGQDFLPPSLFAPKTTRRKTRWGTVRNGAPRCAAIQNSKFEIQNPLKISAPKNRFFPVNPEFSAKERVPGAHATCCVGRRNVLRLPRTLAVSVGMEFSANLERLKCKDNSGVLERIFLRVG